MGMIIYLSTIAFRRRRCFKTDAVLQTANDSVDAECSADLW